MASSRIFMPKDKNRAYHWLFILEYLEEELKPIISPLQYQQLKKELATIEAFQTARKLKHSYSDRFFERSEDESTYFFEHKKVKRFLNIWLSIFIHSPAFQLIGKRFGYSHKKMLLLLGKSRVRPLFTLWALEQFPTISSLFLSHWKLQQYSGLKAIPVKMLFSYWPLYVIYQLQTMAQTPKYMIWMRWLGEGYNIRKAPQLTYVISKRAAHFMMQAPYNCDFQSALFYGRVMAMGGTLDLFRLLSGSIFNINDDIFVDTVIRFFIRYQEEIDLTQADSLLGYLMHMYREDDSYSMKGRTIQSLTRQSNAYYDQLHRRRLADEMEYARREAELQDLDISKWEGAPYQAFHQKGKRSEYRIIQINTYEDIAEEGSAMSHCVANYATDCALGECSIWSLRRFDFAEDQNTSDNKKKIEKMTRLATIEVNDQHEIIQCREKLNGYPSTKAIELLKKWANQEGIKIKSY